MLSNDTPSDRLQKEVTSGVAQGFVLGLFLKNIMFDGVGGSKTTNSIGCYNNMYIVDNTFIIVEGSIILELDFLGLSMDSSNRTLPVGREDQSSTIYKPIKTH